MLNVEKGVLAEVKSDVPGGKSLIDWLNDETEFKEKFIGKRIEGLKATGLIGKIHKFVLSIPEDIMNGLTVDEIKSIVKEVLKEKGVDWEVEVLIIKR